LTQPSDGLSPNGWVFICFGNMDEKWHAFISGHLRQREDGFSLHVRIGIAVDRIADL
jgi:hypothetical protein